MTARKDLVKLCHKCGSEIVPYVKRIRTCAKCVQEKEMEKERAKRKQCPDCGEFFTGHSNRKFCVDCSREHHLQRRRAEAGKRRSAMSGTEPVSTKYEAINEVITEPVEGMVITHNRIEWILQRGRETGRYKCAVKQFREWLNRQGLSIRQSNGGYQIVLVGEKVGGNAEMSTIYDDERKANFGHPSCALGLEGCSPRYSGSKYQAVSGVFYG